MFGRRRRKREVQQLTEVFAKEATENPEIWRMLEAGTPEAYLEMRAAELTEEFAAQPEHEQVVRLERTFAEMYAALNEKRGEDLRAKLYSLWVMVRGRRLARVRRVTTAYRHAAGTDAHELDERLNAELDAIAAALAEQEAEGRLLPDDTVYRTFTLNENLTSLAERHLQNRGPVDVLPLLDVLRSTLLHLSQQTPSGHAVPDLDLEPTDSAVTSEDEDETFEDPELEAQFQEELRAIEAKARAERQEIMAALADTSIAEEQLDQLGWEYLDSGHTDMSPSGPYVAWIRDRIARGPIEDDGGAAMRRVRAAGPRKTGPEAGGAVSDPPIS